MRIGSVIVKTLRMGRPSIGLNLNHCLFPIWQYLCHSIPSQNSVNYLLQTQWIDMRLSKATKEQHDDSDFAKKKKSTFRKKQIFIFVGTFISQIALFGNQKTHNWSYRSQCTHYEWWLGAACGAHHISLKMRIPQALWSMKTLIDKLVFVAPLLSIHVNYIWFQQDGATCYIRGVIKNNRYFQFYRNVFNYLTITTLSSLK